MRTGSPILEEPRSCRWQDTNKYFQWEGEKLISDQEQLLTVYKTTIVPGEGTEWHKEGFQLENIFVNDLKDELAWVAPINKPKGTFILDLGGEMFLSLVQLVNFNRLTENGVEKFKVKLSKTLNGTWDTVLDETLVNNRGQLMSQSDPFPVRQFRFNSTLARFVKFQIISIYGDSAGLQYFQISG